VPYSNRPRQVAMAVATYGKRMMQAWVKNEGAN
jgi:hypothetical protein